MIFILFILIYIFFKYIYIEKFTLYNNFEYSDKLSIDNIKHIKSGQIKMGNMLNAFDNICQKHNIRYFLF